MLMFFHLAIHWHQIFVAVQVALAVILAEVAKVKKLELVPIMVRA